MIDMRPIGYLLGLMVMVLGLMMIFPLIIDIAEARGQWPVFLQSALLTTLVGGLVALSCHSDERRSLSVSQAFLLTTGVWAVLPLFGALPFMLGETQSRFVDAFFEAMSGMTTTGTTIFAGLDDLPKGLLLWRAMLQWLGGLGIVIVALVFLPVMRVGGMQFFASEGFDTMGKVLPRVADISKGVITVYLALTMACALTYYALGMNPFEATAHAFSTVSTGGFSTRDASFSDFPGVVQYAAVIFMLLAGMPFVRLMQGLSGEITPLFRDKQARAYIRWTLYAVALIVAYEVWVSGSLSEAALRARLFNTVSIFSGSGFSDGDVRAWGHMPFVVLIVVGAIGACTGSTSCSIKVFRYQILFAALRDYVQLIISPNRVSVLRYGGRRVEREVVQSVTLLFTVYVLFFGFLCIALELTGLSMIESVTAAWTAIFNIGPVFGDTVGPTGAVSAFPDMAKWLMIGAMLMGRLEIVAVLVLFTPAFWRG